ncbi:MAG: helix-turn-helix domain-containing protein [Christensenellaceae bacterium]|nr:helix-turn-helix domain-containing protein [Christensenellaceae bacterium]
MQKAMLIQSCLDYIEENLKADFSLSELAERCGYSLMHFYKLFSCEVGMPPAAYIKRRRLLAAVYEMRSGKKTEIAMSYGFETYAGFFRAFLREFGYTPSSFIKNIYTEKPLPINIIKEEHIMITRKKISELLSHWELDKETVRSVFFESTGEQNENAFYVSEEYVLKLSRNKGSLKKHNDLAEALAAEGLLSAEAIPADNGENILQDGELYYSLQKRLPGKQLTAKEICSEPENAFHIGKAIGKLHLALKKLHFEAEDFPLFERVSAWAMPNSSKIISIPKDLQEEYLSGFGSLYPMLPRQLIHRDPNLGNIIFSGNEAGFIDFELSERNIRLFDPCYAATSILIELWNKTEAEKHEIWPDIFAHLIQGYDSIMHLTAEEKEALPYVVLSIQFICVAWFHEIGRYPQIFEANKQMTEWLIAHFEELKKLF